MKVLLTAIAFLVLSVTIHAEDWTMPVTGKVYHNVTVTKVEADRVHISHEDGIAVLDLETLPPDLQKRFNYDPTKAVAAREERLVAEAAIKQPPSVYTIPPKPAAQADTLEKPKVDIAALRQQITDLESDAAFQRSQMEAEAQHPGTHGTCHQKYATDISQIDVLSRQLKAAQKAQAQ